MNIKRTWLGVYNLNIGGSIFQLTPLERHVILNSLSILPKKSTSKKRKIESYLKEKNHEKITNSKGKKLSSKYIEKGT